MKNKRKHIAQRKQTKEQTADSQANKLKSSKFKNKKKYDRKHQPRGEQS